MWHVETCIFEFYSCFVALMRFNVHIETQHFRGKKLSMHIIRSQIWYIGRCLSEPAKHQSETFSCKLFWFEGQTVEIGRVANLGATFFLMYFHKALNLYFMSSNYVDNGVPQNWAALCRVSGIGQWVYLSVKLLTNNNLFFNDTLHHYAWTFTKSLGCCQTTHFWSNGLSCNRLALPSLSLGTRHVLYRR